MITIAFWIKIGEIKCNTILINVLFFKKKISLRGIELTKCMVSGALLTTVVNVVNVLPPPLALIRSKQAQVVVILHIPQ